MNLTQRARRKAELESVYSKPVFSVKKKQSFQVVSLDTYKASLIKSLTISVLLAVFLIACQWGISLLQKAN